jgi:hypothetical protein
VPECVDKTSTTYISIKVHGGCAWGSQNGTMSEEGGLTTRVGLLRRQLGGGSFVGLKNGSDLEGGSGLPSQFVQRNKVEVVQQI